MVPQIFIVSKLKVKQLLFQSFGLVEIFGQTNLLLIIKDISIYILSDMHSHSLCRKVHVIDVFKDARNLIL